MTFSGPPETTVSFTNQNAAEAKRLGAVLRAASDAWVEPNVTRGEAIAMGLHCAEYSIGADFFRGYGRTEQEAIRNVLARRDAQAECSVSTDADPSVWSGANWRDVTATELGELR